MSTLAEFSSEELMVPQLHRRDPGAVVTQLGELLEREGRVPDCHALQAAIIRREQLAGTAYAQGWALPHARLGGLASLSFALGRSAEPLSWFGSAQPVRLVFLFAVPELAAAQYLAVISALARFSHDGEGVEQLHRAPDRKTMLRILAQIQLRPPRATAPDAILAR